LKPIQGALDPLALLAGGKLLSNEVDRLINAWGEGAYVFNLGHGILPNTPMEHVGAVLDQIKMRGH
jgi:uroporphyrinogen decarboxylase